MGRRPNCNPWVCLLFPGVVIGSFKLTNDNDSLVVTTDANISWEFEITHQVRRAFKAFMKENNTSTVPNFGMVIVQGKDLSNAEAVAVLPFYDPNKNDFTSRLSTQEALDLYTKGFEEAVKNDAQCK